MEVKLSLHCCCFSHFWPDWILGGIAKVKTAKVFFSRYNQRLDLCWSLITQLRSPEFLFPKLVYSYSEADFTEKVCVFGFRDAARSKPQIFKVVRQEWPFEASSSVGIKILRTACSFMELFSGAACFRCSCTVCGIEDSSKVCAAKPRTSCSVWAALVSCISYLKDLVENICGLSLLFTGLGTGSV